MSSTASFLPSNAQPHSFISTDPLLPRHSGSPWPNTPSSVPRSLTSLFPKRRRPSCQLPNFRLCPPSLLPPLRPSPRQRKDLALPHSQTGISSTSTVTETHTLNTRCRTTSRTRRTSWTRGSNVNTSLLPRRSVAERKGSPTELGVMERILVRRSPSGKLSRTGSGKTESTFQSGQVSFELDVLSPLLLLELESQASVLLQRASSNLC